MMNKTLKYYEENANEFAKGTVQVDFAVNQNRFIALLKGTHVLDFGCGAGRDAKYFLENGLKVDATDGSVELCKYASAYTGIEVKKMLFQELDANEEYDGIWACASILHLPKAELKMVVHRMLKAIKQNGIIYTSFKYGEYEGERNGRFFTDFTLDSFVEFASDIPELGIVDNWITGDARPGRGDEKWLNLILQRK